jgi:hypothetical protein
MSRLFITLSIAIFVLTSCERSSRTIQVQPTNNGVKPGSDDDDSKKSDTRDGITGSIEINISGAAAEASEIEIRWMFNGKSGKRSASLVDGKGRIKINNLEPGTDSLDISGSIDGKAIKPFSASDVTVVKDRATTVEFKIKAAPGGGGGGGGGGGDTDVIIIPEIGPAPKKPDPIDPPAPPAPAEWDGKSFKGNAKWSIEPVKI